MKRFLIWYVEVESSGWKMSPRVMKPNCHCEPGVLEFPSPTERAFWCA
ncbi:MAG TPA: hypothetical protein VG323_08740 [Thermoanaerobaculia bacterium]|nr:hypothetical protein [Thermoanaerobaculia bacterium]